jgi:hypothetical protein
MKKLTKSQVSRQAIFHRAYVIRSWCAANGRIHSFGDCLKTAWLEAHEGKAQYWGFSQDIQNELNGLVWSIQNNQSNAFGRRRQAEAENRMFVALRDAILAGPVSFPLAA